jgi:hypothetical protein
MGEAARMSLIRKHSKLIIVGASCAAIGAGASAIASAGAAGSSTAARSPVARAVHGDLVVATRTGFVTVTLDRGFVQSVSGQQLTVREGTKRATYKTVTLTIPANAVVRYDRHAATLADLEAGQRVLIVQGPNRTLVVARDRASW